MPGLPHINSPTACRCCLPPMQRRRLPRQVYFGAQSHSLHTRCLRFAKWVTPMPRKTRFRLVANLYRTGLITRRIPRQGFNNDLYVASPLSRLSWRTALHPLFYFYSSRMGATTCVDGSERAKVSIKVCKLTADNYGSSLLI
jgi:hypothetical protein